MPPERLIYHFTHIDNLPPILAAGALLSDTDARSAALTTDVGDQAIKAARRSKSVSCGPGGVVADYVPFYFATKSPMMYRIACDHRDGVPDRYSGGDSPLVYLVSSVERVLAAGLPWVASDGNCAARVTRLSADPADLGDLVDWPLLRETIWRDTAEDPDRMRRRAAELLVHRRFPLACLAGYGVHSAEVESALRAVLPHDAASTYVRVRPDWYYAYVPKEVT